jgi:signal transduction histidine kinase
MSPVTSQPTIELPQAPTPRERRRPSPYNLKALGRDYGFVLPGFFLSLAAFCVLVPMISAAVPLVVVWIGVVLLPTTLWLASAFGDLDRARLRWWGHPVARPGLAPRRPGLRGYIGLMAEPRRWLDLVYETLVGFPVHTFTFVVAISWTAATLSGLTEILWLRYIPGSDEGPYTSGYVLDFLSLGTIPASVAHSLWMSYLFDFVTGVIMLALLPLVMRGLALLDAAVMAAALGGTARRAAPAEEADQAMATQNGSPHTPSGIDVRDAGDRESHVSTTGWSWIAAGAFSAALLAVAWPIMAAVYHVHPALAMVLGLGTAIMVLLSVPAQLTWWIVAVVVGALTAAASAILGSTVVGPPWPWPVTGIIALSFMTLIWALRRPWPWAVAGWVVVQVPTVLIGLFWPQQDGVNDHLVLADLIVAASVSLATLLVGIGLRALAASRSALTEERRTSAELSAQRQELDERTRIARELHDVVAHSMSVISVQATTAPYRLPGLDEPTRSEFASIADSSRQALTEMRALLTLLRGSSEHHGPDLAPQATLAQIPELIDATRATGTAIVADLDPLQDDLVAPATGLAAYRILQEGLSNAVRHAPGASIDVSVHLTASAVEISVENGPAITHAPRSPGAGLGLAGVRERAAAVGGDASAQATEQGGFRLGATLPR